MSDKGFDHGIAATSPIQKCQTQHVKLDQNGRRHKNAMECFQIFFETIILILQAGMGHNITPQDQMVFQFGPKPISVLKEV